MFSHHSKSGVSPAPVYADLSQQHVSLEQPVAAFSGSLEIEAADNEDTCNDLNVGNSDRPQLSDEEGMLLLMEHELELETFEPNAIRTEEAMRRTNNADLSHNSYGSLPANNIDEHQYLMSSGATTETTVKSKQSFLMRGRRYANGLCPPAPVATGAISWSDPADIAEYFPKTALYKVPAGVRSSPHFLTPQRWEKEKDLNAYKFSIWSQVMKSGKLMEERDRKRVAQILRQLKWLLQNSWDGKDESTAPPEMLWRARREETRLLERQLQQRLSSIQNPKPNISRLKKFSSVGEQKDPSRAGAEQQPQSKACDPSTRMAPTCRKNGGLFKLLILERRWANVLNKLPREKESTISGIRNMVEQYVNELGAAVDQLADDQYDMGLIENLMDEGYALEKELEMAGFAELCSEWSLFKRSRPRAMSKAVKKAEFLSRSQTVVAASSPLCASPNSRPYANPDASGTLIVKTPASSVTVSGKKTPVHSITVGSGRSTMRSNTPPSITPVASDVSNGQPQVGLVTSGNETPMLPSHTSVNNSSASLVVLDDKTSSPSSCLGTHEILTSLSPINRATTLSVHSSTPGGATPMRCEIQGNTIPVAPTVANNSACLLSSTPKNDMPMVSGVRAKATPVKFSDATPTQQPSVSSIHTISTSAKARHTKGNEGTASETVQKLNNFRAGAQNAETKYVVVPMRKYSDRKRNNDESRGPDDPIMKHSRNEVTALPPTVLLPKGSAEIDNSTGSTDVERRFDLDDLSEIENRWLAFCLEDERANETKFATLIEHLLKWCARYRIILGTPMPKSIAVTRRASGTAKIEKYSNALEALLRQPEGSLAGISSTTNESSDGGMNVLSPCADKQRLAEGYSVDDVCSAMN
ncbi:hypothetical protein Tcan_04711 [Toxocara canis]|uniref:Uncharacterized protein n=1 Tax=Toxocara canis TaxID=6265 RepID=A0A0B2VEM7_TOXCA|nr:hypothetical protein Tcan_04711 [Toxocara canis]